MKKANDIQKKLDAYDFIVPVSILKNLANTKRLQAAFVLTQEKEISVCAMARVIEVSISTASYHLRLLRKMGLAKSRKEQNSVFYSVKSEEIKELLLTITRTGGTF